MFFIATLHSIVFRVLYKYLKYYVIIYEYTVDFVLVCCTSFVKIVNEKRDDDCFSSLRSYQGGKERNCFYMIIRLFDARALRASVKEIFFVCRILSTVTMRDMYVCTGTVRRQCCFEIYSEKIKISSFVCYGNANKCRRESTEYRSRSKECTRVIVDTRIKQERKFRRFKRWC